VGVNTGTPGTSRPSVSRPTRHDWSEGPLPVWVRAGRRGGHRRCRRGRRWRADREPL